MIGTLDRKISSSWLYLALGKHIKEPIPEHFESAKEAGDFLDVYDLPDYWDPTRETDLIFGILHDKSKVVYTFRSNIPQKI